MNEINRSVPATITFDQFPMLNRKQKICSFCTEPNFDTISIDNNSMQMCTSSIRLPCECHRTTIHCRIFPLSFIPDISPTACWRSKQNSKFNMLHRMKLTEQIQLYYPRTENSFARTNSSLIVVVDAFVAFQNTYFIRIQIYFIHAEGHSHTHP